MTTTLPILSADAGLAHYLQEIKKFPVLDAEEEQVLARQWADEGNLEAAHKLVTSHLRLVAKIAMGFRGYGLPLVELISEGNIGLMQAVKRFDPSKGFRLSTYAMWWIKAAIQEYVLRSWSLVKIGTTAAQKKLFFNLRKLKNRLNSTDKSLYPEEIESIADELNVSTSEVVDMDMRLSHGDFSLNEPLAGDEDNTTERLDMIAAPEDSQETLLAEAQESNNRQMLLISAMDTLNPREREILERRRLREEPDTLEMLSQDYGISRERVRQIEARAIEKLQSYMHKEIEAQQA